MTQRFKRKTLAVSIAAALFGGMALAVAPIMTPVAMANQFEGSSMGTRTSTNLFTGASAGNVQTGTITIESSSVQLPWQSSNSTAGGQFTVTLPAGIQLSNGTAFLTPTPTTVQTEINALNAAFTVTVTGAVGMTSKLVAVGANSSSQPVMTFEIFGNALTSDTPTSFTFGMMGRMTTPDKLTVDFADALIRPLGLGSNPNLKSVELASFYDTSAVVEVAAATSVDSDRTNQAIARVEVQTLATSPTNPSRILFTLDKGTWVTPDPTSIFKKVSDTQLETEVSANTNPRSFPFQGMLINTVGVSTDTDINVTVTSQADGTRVAIPNFGTHKVKVARTKGTSGKDVTVGLTTDPTTDVVYVGRRNESVTNVVKLAEAMPGTLTANGTLNYTLSTGVFNPASTMNVAGADSPTCAPISGTTASAKFECYANGPTLTTAGAWTLTPRPGTSTTVPRVVYTGPFDMYNATVGDLNVTIDGTAWTNWTSNVVKLADVKKATTSTLDGSIDTLRLSSSGAAVKMTLPDIVIQENNAGALIGGEYFVVAIDDGLNLIVLPTTEAKVFNKDGTELSTLLSIRSPSELIGFGGPGATDPRGIDIQWAALPAANGPYKIVISGLQVEADSSSTSPGDYNLSVASTLLDDDIRPIDYRSDIFSTVVGSVAGAYFETFPAVKVIDSATTTAWVDASGPIDDLSAYANILPGAGDRGKSGSYYLMLQMPPQFTGDWSLWTLGPSGWTMVTPAFTDPELCSTMTSYQGGTLGDVTNMPLVVDTDMTVFKDVSVWTGYGVGATLFHPEAPCLNMLENSTYWYVYTVK